MNIFHHTDSFFSCPDSRVTEDSLLSIFKLAKQIRLQLGKQGYLLDHYLSMIFEGMSSGQLAFESADEGFRAGGELQGLLFHVLDGTEPQHEHPLYPRMKELYQQYEDKLIFQERYTNLSILLLFLADEAILTSTGKFVKEQVTNIGGSVDIIRVQEVYDQISHIAGESMLEELNKRIKQRFIIAPASTLFAQGFTDELLYKLTYRDIETSRQIFQLFLDMIPSDTDEVQTHGKL
ncbi:hypothetical protein [Bariatricus massiliensis]|uniref:Uncharacterized protein n=1 Tax=Bariatricus massiliensis TaxID=1745713 RepID=A0ABS8DFL0_9FIRM|nr:hypothetical protein [Bariatricus massiliensis]MCB7304100.1 hypothetical protein [Bariatricus massiliensis]MCB7374469.1 hypothetical protein [Bariatricus massiliensis]MCB7387210.1 hypothetical protein [Bariatricus massiliensis]MCB7411372.1 hypothetical protein [Bariatricus massiliensis]